VPIFAKTLYDFRVLEGFLEGGNQDIQGLLGDAGGGKDAQPPVEVLVAVSQLIGGRNFGKVRVLDLGGEGQGTILPALSAAPQLRGPGDQIQVPPRSAATASPPDP